MTQKTHFADDDTLKYIAELKRQLAEAQRDSERWQFVRDKVPPDTYYEMGIVLENGGIDELNAAIDQAIQEQKK